MKEENTNVKVPKLEVKALPPPPQDERYSPEDEIASLDSTPLKDMPSPMQDETDIYKYIDKIAYLILNNLPLRLKHLIKLRRLEEVSFTLSLLKLVKFIEITSSFIFRRPIRKRII